MITKKIILLSSLFLLLGCKVKRVNKDSIKVTEKVESKFEHKIDSIVHSKEFKEDVKSVKIQDVKKEDNSNIEIKGKVDKDNPLTYYNVKDGDTISSIKVTGNAEVIFKGGSSFTDHFKSNDSISVKNTQNESSVKSNSVVDKVAEKVLEVQERTVRVVKRDFQPGTYIVFFLFGLAIIAGFIFLRWFKKPEIFNKIFKKDEDDSTIS